jgi:lipopolysaccharide/colanic/teichoic acid biosynthesis glycosyltransferase
MLACEYLKARMRHDETRANERALLMGIWLIGDAAAITLALNVAFNVRYSIDWLPLFERLAPISERYAIVIPLAIPLWLVLFGLNGLYNSRYTLSGLQEYGKIASACSFGILVLIVLSFLEPNLSISRSWLVFCWIFSILFVTVERFSIRRLVKAFRARGHFLSRAIVVGANEQAKAIARQLSPATESGVVVVGFLDDFLPRDAHVLNDLRVLDRPSALERIANEKGATEAIIVQGAVAWESFMEIITRSMTSLNGLDIKLSPGFYELMATGVRVSHDGFVPLLALEKNRITGAEALLKSLFDYSISALSLLLLSPIIAVIAVLIRLTAGDSAFEPYRVLGVGEKPFVTWKFRTSKASEDHAMGRSIYRMGFDKLPQLLNVLRGEMSLVGPRPVPVTRADVYQEWLPTLLAVKPGLTGPWVVSGVEADSLDAEIRLDLYYIRSWTIWLDLQIVLQTILRLFQGERPLVRR